MIENKKIIPFKKESIGLLEKIQCDIQRYEKDGHYQWANEYRARYNEVLNYVNHGSIPNYGFSEHLRLSDLPCVPDSVRCNRFYGHDDANLKKAVQDANNFLYPMPLGSLESFYAICTSSTHTYDIRSKVNYNDPVHFSRALQNPPFRECYTYCGFKSYVIERGESLNLPFKFTRSDDKTLIIGKEFNLKKTAREFSRTILDLYKGITTSTKKSYSKNIGLDVFVIDNNLDFNYCITKALDLLNGVQLSNDREIIIKEALHGKSNNEWYIPNYRITISDTQDLVECYLTLRFIPLPSFIEMITYRANSLQKSLNSMPKHHDSFPNELIYTLKSDLQIICNFRNELQDISDEIDLSKYESVINNGRIPGYPEYNTQMQWDFIPKNIFTAVYELFETYNHYKTLDETKAKLPAKFDMCDDLQGHILRSLQNFGRDTSNYLNAKSNNIKLFKSELEISTKLVTYLDNHEKYIAHKESNEGAGRLDIKIEYKYKDKNPLMIEVKLFKESKKGVGMTESAIHEIFDSSIRQIEEYTAHGTSVGMLLFFTLDLNEGEIAEVIDRNSLSNGFEKIPKNLRSNKINYLVNKGDKVYPIRFMKLNSKPPSSR